MNEQDQFLQTLVVGLDSTLHACCKCRGNRVIMAPNAFSEENAMKTFEELDRQQLLGRRKETPPASQQHKTMPAEKNMSTLDPGEIKVGHSTALFAGFPEWDCAGGRHTYPACLQGIFDLMNTLDEAKSPGAWGDSDQSRGALFDINDDDTGECKR